MTLVFSELSFSSVKWVRKRNIWDFPGSPVVKNSPCNAGDSCWIPVWETKIPHGSGATKSKHHNYWVWPLHIRESMQPNKRSHLTQCRSWVPQLRPNKAKLKKKLKSNVYFMELLFMWKFLLQFLMQKWCSISGGYYSKVFYLNIKLIALAMVWMFMIKEWKQNSWGYSLKATGVGIKSTACKKT